MSIYCHAKYIATNCSEQAVAIYGGLTVLSNKPLYCAQWTTHNVPT